MAGFVLAGHSLSAQLWIRKSFQCFDREWVSLLKGSNTHYDRPVFLNVRPNHFFHHNTTTGWITGLAVSPKSHFPFIKDLAEKVCQRTKEILKSPFFGLPYKLMVDSLGSDLKINPTIQAMYMKKDENYLQIGSTGKWWAGIFRRGKLVRSIITTREDSMFSAHNTEIAFSTIFPIECNDLLIATKAEYGKKNEDIISVAVETGEHYSVLLQQMAENLQPSLWNTDPNVTKEILVILRMVPSEEQVLEL